MTQALNLAAIVTPAERAAVVAGVEQLSECLGTASGGAAWPIQLSLFDPVSVPPPDPAPAAIVLSLLGETANPGEPIETTHERWRASIAALVATGAPVLIMNVFRNVHGPSDDQARAGVMERIRRLDLMAARLSREFAVGVVDIDRAFAHIGARALQTDYRLGGPLAREVAGHTLAWALLSFGLDDSIDPGLQEKARGALGGLAQINAIVSRRLARPQAPMG